MRFDEAATGGGLALAELAVFGGLMGFATITRDLRHLCSPFMSDGRSAVSGVERERPDFHAEQSYQRGRLTRAGRA